MRGVNATSKKKVKAVVEGEEGEDGEGSEGEWSDSDEDFDYDEYHSNIKQAGFSVNHLGELVLPSGKTLGHRALNRYYKQRYNDEDTRTSVVAAKNNIAQKMGYDSYEVAPRTSLAVKAGIGEFR